MSFPQRPSRAPGFTLVELLIVMGIIALLTGAMMPIYGIVKRASLKNASEYVLKKVDTALRLFKTDWKVYPGQQAYPAAPADLTNRLYYHLGTELDPAKQAQIQLDAQEAGNLFAYNSVGGASASEQSPQPSPLTYTKACIGNSVLAAALLNRMGRDRARLAAVSGNLWLRGPVISSNYAATISIIEDKRGTAVFPAAHSAASGPTDPGPGWACDYLAGDLEAKYIAGAAVVDPWGRPLVYICQQIPGILGISSTIWNGQAYIHNSKSYGLGPIGFDASQGPGPALATTRPYLLYGGRVILSGADAGDSHGPTPTDASFFPNVNVLLHSDVRYYAAARFARDFELWSCGPDQSFDYMRDGDANHDNISVTPYNRDL